MLNINKNIETIKLSIKNDMCYKFNFYINMIYSILPMVATIFLWLYIYSTKETIGNYQKEQMLSYYFLIFFVSNLLQVGIKEFSYIIEIKNGSISKYFLRPYDFGQYLFFTSLHSTITFLLFFSIPILFAYFLLRNYMVIQLSATHVLFLLGSIVLGYFINFYMKWMVISLAFFLNNVSTLPKAIGLLKQLVGGTIIPLNLLPEQVFFAFDLLPFKYLGYYQVSICLNYFSIAEMTIDFMIEIMWTVILCMLCKFIWNKGMRIYTCFGG